MSSLFIIPENLSRFAGVVHKCYNRWCKHRMINGHIVQKTFEMAIGSIIIVSPAYQYCRACLILDKAKDKGVVGCISVKFQSCCIIQRMGCAIQIEILSLHFLTIDIHCTNLGSMVICANYMGPFLANKPFTPVPVPELRSLQKVHPCHPPLSFVVPLRHRQTTNPVRLMFRQ